MVRGALQVSAEAVERERPQRVVRGPLHKRCMASMLDCLLGEGSISDADSCADCYEWAMGFYHKWREDNWGE